MEDARRDTSKRYASIMRDMLAQYRHEWNDLDKHVWLARFRAIVAEAKAQYHASKAVAR